MKIHRRGNLDSALILSDWTTLWKWIWWSIRESHQGPLKVKFIGEYRHEKGHMEKKMLEPAERISTEEWNNRIWKLRSSTVRADAGGLVHQPIIGAHSFLGNQLRSNSFHNHRVVRVDPFDLHGSPPWRQRNRNVEVRLMSMRLKFAHTAECYHRFGWIRFSCCTTTVDIFG